MNLKDIEIAERVMRWTRFEGAAILASVIMDPCVATDRAHLKTIWARKSPNGKLAQVACEECGDMPAFSTQLDPAFMAYAEMNKRGWWITKIAHCYPAIGGGEWLVRLMTADPGDESVQAYASTLAGALAEALLRAVASEEARRNVEPAR